jgi:ribosomal protein S18 acetylase RimI-like enzyme
MVLAEYRRRGVASMLWRAVERIVQEIGAWRTRLCVEADNEIARNFYRSVGLEERSLILCERRPRRAEGD